MVPRLVRRAPSSEWPTIRDELNNMIYFARQEAITSQIVHRLVFAPKQGEIYVEKLVKKNVGKNSSVSVATSSGKKQEKDLFEKVHSHYFTSNYMLPEAVSITSLKRGKKDLLPEGKNPRGYCYVVPHGLVESLTLVLTRTEDESSELQEFNMEPFLGKFVLDERGDGNE